MPFSRLVFRLALFVFVPILLVMVVWSLLPFRGDVLIFSAYLEDHYSVFTLDIDRHIIHTVTPFNGNVYNPRWSPDGEQIAFVYGRDIYVSDASGRYAYNLTNTREIITNTLPVWSPDGAHIAFVSDRVGQQNLFVMDRNGENVRNLTPELEVRNAPIWSPDSTQLLLNVNDGTESQMVRVTFETGEIAGFEGAGEVVGGIAWSPDGSQLAYLRWNDRTFQLVVEDISTGDTQIIHDSINTTSLPHWSPDSTKLTYVISIQNGQRIVYVRDLRDNDDKELFGFGLTRNIIIESPRWSPDGERIAFLSNHESLTALYTISTRGGGLERISPANLSLVSDPQWRP
ncbi:MAG: DPP IV N-terminal domain-containing protein [Aggregatilineales bacterium]